MRHNQEFQNMSLSNVIKSFRQGKLPPVKEVPSPIFKTIGSLGKFRGKFSRLSSIERVLTTIQHKQPDRVPVSPMAGAAARQIRGISFPDYSQNAEKTAEVFTSSYEFIGGDLVVLLLDLSIEAADFGQVVIFPENSTAYSDYDNPVIKDVDDYKNIRPLKLENTRRMKEFVRLCDLMVKRIGFRSMVTGFLFSPLGILSMMRGAERFFKDCLNHKKAVIRACEPITETLLEYVQAQCDTGVPAIAIDTLYASWNGLSRELWEEIEGPYVKEISSLIRRNKRVTAIHNCGHGPYFDSQIKFMEPEVISFAHLPDDCKTDKELKEKYGGQVTLFGYVPTPLLVHGTPQEVIDECLRQIDVLGKDGGFILAPGCEYPPNTPLTNAFAMVKAAQMHS